jgi:aldehyde:ferredoxin oxidoreductase
MPSFEDFSRLVNLNTGLEIPAEELWRCAERAYNLERLFNLREGATDEDDRLPERYFNEPVPGGPKEVRGMTLDRDKFRSMIQEYYWLHHWDINGIPEPEKLQELSLDGEQE